MERLRGIRLWYRRRSVTEAPENEPGIRSEPLAELDDDLKIKVLRLAARITTCNLKDIFGELFGFLTERQFAKELPKTEEDCEKLLENDLSQAVYDIARSKRWLPLIPVGRKTIYSEWIYGDRARELNALNKPDRLPTMEETRDSYWRQLVLEWEARFLEMRKATAAETKAGPDLPQPVRGNACAIHVGAGVGGADEREVLQTPRRGRRANRELNYAVGRIVGNFGPDWDKCLTEICEALDSQDVPLPASNKWKESGCATWQDVFDTDREGLVKALGHRLDWVSKHPLHQS